MVFKISLILSLRYLENEYIHHCVPSNVSSGLGRLPLSHVWYDGVEAKNNSTDPTLPTGESLNGPKAYSLIMPYFTTNNMNASDVHDLGKKQLEKLYPLVSTTLLIFKLNLHVLFLCFYDSHGNVRIVRKFERGKRACIAICNHQFWVTCDVLSNLIHLAWLFLSVLFHMNF